MRKLDELHRIPKSIAIKEYERWYLLSLPVFIWIILDSFISSVIYGNWKLKSDTRKVICKKLREDFKAAQLDEKICDFIDELFLIRDIIVHNHIYPFKITISGERIYEDKLSWFDWMIENCVTENQKITKKLNLHIIPDEITNQDCKNIAEAFLQILNAFGVIDKNKFLNLFNSYLDNSYDIYWDKTFTTLRTELVKFHKNY